MALGTSLEANDNIQPEYKYWAFINYSHQDKQWGDWLHKALETYRVPLHLVGLDLKPWDPGDKEKGKR